MSAQDTKLPDSEAYEVALDVSYIYEAIRQSDDPWLASHMLRTDWWAFAKNCPDMTAEEIASAAASGFVTETLYEVV
jgi:hypothetical protein